MTEKTASAIQAEIESAHSAYMAELKQAAPLWEVKPASGEGEDAWSARQVAEHIAGANLFFGNGIAQALGGEAPALARMELASADAAVTRTTETHAALATVVAGVNDGQLNINVDHPRLGKQTVASLLEIVAHHYRDHADQLRTLRGG